MVHLPSSVNGIGIPEPTVVVTLQFQSPLALPPRVLWAKSVPAGSPEKT